MVKPEKKSLFFSDEWTYLEERILGYDVMWFKEGKNTAKVTVTPSRVSFIKKNWLGGIFGPETGMGFYSHDPSGADAFYKKIRSGLSGVIQGISNTEISKISTRSLTRIVDLSQDENSLLASFTNSRQRGVRQGSKRGAKVKLVKDAGQAVDVIFRIKSRYPSFRRGKLELLKILEYLFDKGLAGLFVTYVDEEPVAEVLLTLWRGRMSYSISGYLPEYSKYRPMDILVWEAMKWGAARGFSEFDMMGGCGKSDTGTNKFKSEFGGAIEKKYYFKEIKIGPFSF